MIDFFFVTTLNGDRVLINPKHIVTIQPWTPSGSARTTIIRLINGGYVNTKMSIAEIIDAWNTVED